MKQQIAQQTYFVELTNSLFLCAEKINFFMLKGDSGVCVNLLYQHTQV